MFQFYLSSIKRKAGILVKKLEKCFNSTLVQLKAELEKHREIIKQSFNSTLVQLKENTTIICLLFLYRFNSTLVQLKAFVLCLLFRLVFVSILP